jgi:hypothetical protein
MQKNKGELRGQNKPIENLWNEGRFNALRNELNATLYAEHEKVLQLICFKNPAPEYWQPMSETCEGVSNRYSLESSRN